MKLFAFVIFALAVFAFAWAEDTCKVGSKVLKVGEKHSKPGECQLYECNGGGKLSAKSCPQIAVPSHCKRIPKDLSKPYPACCETAHC